MRLFIHTYNSLSFWIERKAYCPLPFAHFSSALTFHFLPSSMHFSITPPLPSSHFPQ